MSMAANAAHCVTGRMIDPATDSLIEARLIDGPLNLAVVGSLIPFLGAALDPSIGSRIRQHALWIIGW